MKSKKIKICIIKGYGYTETIYNDSHDFDFFMRNFVKTFNTEKQDIVKNMEFSTKYYTNQEEMNEAFNDGKIDAYVVIGGGDTVNAVNKLLPNNNFVISTGGGASLEYLEGKGLPGIIEG